MLNKLKLYVARRRLENALRRKGVANNDLIQKLKKEVASCEIAVLIDVIYMEAGL